MLPLVNNIEYRVYQELNEEVPLSRLDRNSRNMDRQAPAPVNVYTNSACAPPMMRSPQRSKKAQEISRVIDEINRGYKVIVILRGLPGSGKSTLAKTLLKETIGFHESTMKNHILSTDDFFMKNNVYRFNKDQLSEAHGWNHRRAFKSMSYGYSPVIIDNTNTSMWEMKPYAMMATDYGYILEIIEPDTHWCFNETELAKRNAHGVPKLTIRSMLERYEKNVTPMKLLTAYDCKYKLQKVPQYRIHPPIIKIERQNSNEVSYQPPIKSQSTSVDDILMQKDDNLLNYPVLSPVPSGPLQPASSMFDKLNINGWGVDEQAIQSWEIVTPLNDDTKPPVLMHGDEELRSVETTEVACGTTVEDFVLVQNSDLKHPNVKVINALSRDINDNTRSSGAGAKSKNRTYKTMVDQSTLTENAEHFTNLELLKNCFPNIGKHVIQYWYNKCCQDMESTFELLLSEKEEVIHNIIETPPIEEDKSPAPDSDSGSSSSSSSSSSNSSEERMMNRIRHKRSINETRHLQKCFEEKFTISDHHYSEQLLKVKYGRSGARAPTVEPQPTAIEETATNLEQDQTSSEEEEETIEICLNDQIIEKLENQFGDPTLLYPKGFQPVVQIPTSLAQQLYTFYIESVYQQMDAQKSVVDELVKEDEEFARKLQEAEEEEEEENEEKRNGVSPRSLPNSVAEEQAPAPMELPDIIREQKELSKWQRFAEKWKENTPDTLAFKLTKQKLFDLFPSVPQDTLLEILHAHDNVYKETVEVLLTSTNGACANGNRDDLMMPPLAPAIMQEMWLDHDSCKTDDDRKYQDEEGATCAVDYRERANCHLAKRTQLFEKAQRYYQRGMREVAQFYSNLAQAQTRLYDQSNSLAATAFLDEHSKRLEDFNTLDLHFLYVKEALPNLDIFLDRNITLLRTSGSGKSSEWLQIITGRGKNSINGVSKLKPAIISRLKERQIQYHVLNPGLLKVKVHKNLKVTNEL